MKNKKLIQMLVLTLCVYGAGNVYGMETDSSARAPWAQRLGALAGISAVAGAGLVGAAVCTDAGDQSTLNTAGSLLLLTSLGLGAGSVVAGTVSKRSGLEDRLQKLQEQLRDSEQRAAQATQMSTRVAQLEEHLQSVTREQGQAYAALVEERDALNAENEELAQELDNIAKLRIPERLRDRLPEVYREREWTVEDMVLCCAGQINALDQYKERMADPNCAVGALKSARGDLDPDAITWLLCRIGLTESAVSEETRAVLGRCKWSGLLETQYKKVLGPIDVEAQKEDGLLKALEIIAEHNIRVNPAVVQQLMVTLMQQDRAAFAALVKKELENHAKRQREAAQRAARVAPTDFDYESDSDQVPQKYLGDYLVELGIGFVKPLQEENAALKSQLEQASVKQIEQQEEQVVQGFDQASSEVPTAS